MNFCVVVTRDHVLQTAMTLVKKAKKSIVVTMDMDEELLNPLPKAYHALLIQRYKEGISVTRYGFGTKRAFDIIRNKHKKIPCVYVGSLTSYQRMLVIDRTYALFRLGEQVYCADFVPLAIALEKYAQTVYNKENL